MKHFVAVLLAGLLLGAGSWLPENLSTVGLQESSLDLLFVANEGVMVSTKSSKVLIDALFTNPHPDYAAPPVEMLEQMETGQAPFDDLDLVLVTHNHPDHFDPSSAGRLLGNNTRAVLVAPEDAVVALRDSVPDWASIDNRVISIGLEPGTTTERTIDGIKVTAYRTLHSGDRETPQNLMYLIEMDDRTIFHEGDSDGNPNTFARFGLGDKHIDLALVHFWFPTNLEAEGILRGILKPDHIGLFHLPKRLMDDAPGTIGQVAADYQDMFLLLSPGERRTFHR